MGSTSKSLAFLGDPINAGGAIGGQAAAQAAMPKMPDYPAPPPPPPPPAATPPAYIPPSPSASAAGNQVGTPRSSGLPSTVITGPEGLKPGSESTSKKQLLGS